MKGGEVEVSLICTVKNEEASIDEFLESILAQSRLPDEFVIVDGGSTDDTVKKVELYVAKASFPIKVLVRPNTNVSQAENIAVKHATHDLIACTAAGCTFDKDWLKNLIKPFEQHSDVKVVAGWYEADARTPFERRVAEMTMPKVNNINPNEFLPSSRSVAFHRSAWEKVGGFPEWLTLNADDTLFDIKLKEAGYTFHFASDAIVFWQPRCSYRGLWKQYFGYARGDGEASIFTARYLGLIFGKYLLGASLLWLGFLHWPFWVILAGGIFYFMFNIMRKHSENFVGALKVILVKESAEILGWFKGRWNRITGKVKPT